MVNKCRRREKTQSNPLLTLSHAIFSPMKLTIPKILHAIRHPAKVQNYYVRGVDFFPPQNFRKHFRLRFYLVELPARWIFKGVFPQHWDGNTFKTFFDEDIFIDKYFHSLDFLPKTFVDIGAGDGIDMSNTFRLAHRGLVGISIEGNPVRFAQLSLTYEKFPNVQLVRKYVSSSSVSDLITSSGLPKNFDVLNLDIDSFDYHVLESLLGFFEPKLMVIEWNRSFPPNIFFTVNNDPTIRWDSQSALFQGASLLAFYELLTNFNYKIVAVQGAAIFASPVDSSPAYPSLTAEDAWSQYLKGPGKWINTNLDYLELNKEDLVKKINSEMIAFSGKYQLR